MMLFEGKNNFQIDFSKFSTHFGQFFRRFWNLELLALGDSFFAQNTSSGTNFCEKSCFCSLLPLSYHLEMILGLQSSSKMHFCVVPKFLPFCSQAKITPEYLSSKSRYYMRLLQQTYLYFAFCQSSKAMLPIFAIQDSSKWNVTI